MRLPDVSSARLADFVKAYDVRGLVPQQWGPAEARAIGSAFAQVVVLPEQGSAVAIGHDMRDSSPELSEAFAAGVAAHGVDVTLIGLCATDVLYYLSGAQQQAGAMFTASHNPAGWNGIKMCWPGARPVGMDTGLAEVRDLAQWILDRADLHPPATPGRIGTISRADVLSDYAAYLHSLVDLRAGRPLKLVVDAGNGMAGLTVPAVLQAPGLPLEVVPLYFELDGTFPNHEANPLDPENMRDLQAAVLEHGADLGLAFDGDADRCFVVDERGELVTVGAISALVATREIAREVAAGRPVDQVAVVHSAIASRVLPDTVRALGARAVPSRVGHSFVKAQMAQYQAVFGAEHSAHYYFRDFWFADSGMLAAMHLLAALGEQELPLSELVARYQRHTASGEINSRVVDVSATLDRVREWALQQGAEAETMDGLMMSHDEEPSWRFSLRVGNTEPFLRLNVEAADMTTMEQVRDSVLALVRQED